jgi:hypothetical protein
MLRWKQRKDAADRAAEGCCGGSSGRMLRWEQLKDAAVEAAEGCCGENSGRKLQWKQQKDAAVKAVVQSNVEGLRCCRMTRMQCSRGVGN